MQQYNRIVREYSLLSYAVQKSNSCAHTDTYFSWILYLTLKRPSLQCTGSDEIDLENRDSENRHCTLLAHGRWKLFVVNQQRRNTALRGITFRSGWWMHVYLFSIWRMFSWFCVCFVNCDGIVDGLHHRYAVLYPLLSLFKTVRFSLSNCSNF